MASIHSRGRRCGEHDDGVDAPSLHPLRACDALGVGQRQVEQTPSKACTASAFSASATVATVNVFNRAERVAFLKSSSHSKMPSIVLNSRRSQHHVHNRRGGMLSNIAGGSRAAARRRRLEALSASEATLSCSATGSEAVAPPGRIRTRDADRGRSRSRRRGASPPLVRKPRPRGAGVRLRRPVAPRAAAPGRSGHRRAGRLRRDARMGAGRRRRPPPTDDLLLPRPRRPSAHGARRRAPLVSQIGHAWCQTRCLTPGMSNPASGEAASVRLVTVEIFYCPT